MSAPRLLDLFCGAGGATRGYQRAGFHVVGVDINPQPNYVGDEFYQLDATAMVQDVLNGCWHEAYRKSALPGMSEMCLGHFDAVHASPPCQDKTALNIGRIDHGTGWMLDATIRLVKAAGLPWVVENVVGPSVRMDGWYFTLCGSSFGLGVRRHRRFGSSVTVLAPGCRHDLQPEPVDVTGTGGPAARPPGQRGGIHRKPRNLAHAREAMGIDWMTRAELSQAIPPAYTEFIGAHLLAAVEAAA